MIDFPRDGITPTYELQKITSKLGKDGKLENSTMGQNVDCFILQILIIKLGDKKCKVYLGT